MAKNMYPSWLHVEYAITRLISFCTKPTVAAKKAVEAQPLDSPKAVGGERRLRFVRAAVARQNCLRAAATHWTGLLKAEEACRLSGWLG